MNRIKNIWVVTKQSYLCRCDSYIKIVPYLEHFELVGMLRKNNEKDYIMVDYVTGCIQAAGKRLFNEIMGIDPETFERQRVYIQIFSPELMTLFEKPEEIYNRTITVHFLVPKNLQNFLSAFSAERHYAEARKATLCDP
jgi:hypothetical protein